MIRSLSDLSNLARAASRLAVVLMALPAWAQANGASAPGLAPVCAEASADGDPLWARRIFTWQGRQLEARACWLGQQAGQGDRVVLELQLEGQPLVRHQTPADQSLEGALDELRFDSTRFMLAERAEGGLTLALRLATRNRGAEMDDRFVYLWLYQFDGRRLQRVLEMSTDERSDFRGCNDECAPATVSRSVVVVQPGAGHHGLRDLRLRQRSWTEGPDGQPVGGLPPWRDQIHVFDGISYQPRP